jgi:hypothetical protein
MRRDHFGAAGVLLHPLHLGQRLDRAAQRLGQARQDGEQIGGEEQRGVIVEHLGL